jgi:Plasmid stabilization system protein
MAKAIWTDPALDDLRSIVSYIAVDSPVYAERFGMALVRAPRHLEDHPRIGRIVPEFEDESIREIIHGSYRIIYLIRGDDCFIVAVVHGSRDLLRLLDHDDFVIE